MKNNDSILPEHNLSGLVFMCARKKLRSSELFILHRHKEKIQYTNVNFKTIF